MTTTASKSSSPPTLSPSWLVNTLIVCLKLKPGIIPHRMKQPLSIKPYPSPPKLSPPYTKKNVALILGTMSLLSASSLLHLLPSIIPCLRMSHDIFVGPVRGVWSFVDLLQICHYLAPPLNSLMDHSICPTFPFQISPVNSLVLWMQPMLTTFAVAVLWLSMLSSWTLAFFILL